MECDQYLKPLPDHTQCGGVTLKVSRIVTGEVESITRSPGEEKGVINLRTATGQAITVPAGVQYLAHFKPGQKFELEGNTIKIFSTVELFTCLGGDHGKGIKPCTEWCGEEMCKPVE